MEGYARQGQRNPARFLSDGGHGDGVRMRARGSRKRGNRRMRTTVMEKLIVELESLLLIFPVAKQLLKASVHLSRDFVL